jgi:hypothetical protein
MRHDIGKKLYRVHNISLNFYDFPVRKSKTVNDKRYTSNFININTGFLNVDKGLQEVTKLIYLESIKERNIFKPS